MDNLCRRDRSGAGRHAVRLNASVMEQCQQFVAQAACPLAGRSHVSLTPGDKGTMQGLGTLPSDTNLQGFC